MLQSSNNHTRKKLMGKNILELCLSDGIGGLELFVGTCYQSFKDKTNTYLCVEKDSKLDKFYDQEKKFYLKRNKFFPIFPSLKLANFIDEKDIDIIHFHWTRDINLVVLAKVLSRKKPKIIQTRNMSMTRFKDDFYHKWLYRNIDTMHAVTNQVKEQIEKFVPSEICPKVEMVYMGCEASSVNMSRVDELKKQYKLQDEFIVGIVGRIEEEKGQFLVIEALAKLKDLNIKAMIVGLPMEESYLEELKQKVSILGIEDKVIFTGFTKEVNEHMQLFDVNILATPKETFGLVVIEAMANGICMIATGNAGPLEIIDNEINGLHFDRTSEDLANKIKKLYDNPILKKELALKGKEKAQIEFDKNTQLEKLYQVIQKTIKEQ